MPRTKQDLATEAMRRLALLEAQEEAAAEDAADIIRIYEQKMEEWRFRDLAWWPDDAIPDMAFGYVADQIAEIIASHFGAASPQVQDETGDAVSIGTRGLRGIRRLKARERSGLSTKGVFF